MAQERRPRSATPGNPRRGPESATLGINFALEFL